LQKLTLENLNQKGQDFVITYDHKNQNVYQLIKTKIILTITKVRLNVVVSHLNDADWLFESSFKKVCLGSETEFKGDGRHVSPNFWTGGDIISFVCPNIL